MMSNITAQTIASAVLMVRPHSFTSNPETQSSNAFQAVCGSPAGGRALIERAQIEFDELQRRLIASGVGVLAFSEQEAAHTPDALFPNNWFVSLPDGRVFLMPMYAENRRREYRPDIVNALYPTEVIDLRSLSEKNLFLEGTGSLILDHESKTGFACRSVRTSDQAVQIFSELSGYRITVFDSVDRSGQAIYHTNVMMALSPDLAIVNLSSILDSRQRNQLVTQLNRDILDITETQMQRFAGNMLFLQNRMQRNFWICSDRARASLTEEQKEKMQKSAEFISADLQTIETYGGGGARCLLAEVFGR